MVLTVTPAYKSYSSDVEENMLVWCRPKQKQSHPHFKNCFAENETVKEEKLQTASAVSSCG